MEDKPYEEMSLDELKKLKEEMEKKKIIEELTSEENITPVSEPENPVENEGESIMDTDAAHMKVLKRFKDAGVPFINYEDESWLYTNTTSDSGCDDDVSAWSPEDVYAGIIWGGLYSKVDLFKVAVKGINVKQGDGMTVQIRAFGKIGNPSEKGACEIGSCASITFSTYSVTIKQYNLEAVVCDYDVWDAGSVVLDSYIKAMTNAWADYFNSLIYNALSGATPGHTETLAHALDCSPELSGSCCTDSSLFDMYNAVMNAVATMRENYYDPDYIILSPTVAAIFKRMQTPHAPAWGGYGISFDASGRLTKLAGLNVIEYEGAQSCATTSGAKVAIIVDSSRAVGTAFGKKPQLYKFFLTNSNAYRLDMWAYFGVSALDTNAICHIVNP